MIRARISERVVKKPNQAGGQAWRGKFCREINRIRPLAFLELLRNWFPIIETI